MIGVTCRYTTVTLIVPSAARALAFCVAFSSAAGGATVRIAARALRIAAISLRHAAGAVGRVVRPSRWPLKFN